MADKTVEMVLKLRDEASRPLGDVEKAAHGTDDALDGASKSGDSFGESITALKGPVLAAVAALTAYGKTVYDLAKFNSDFIDSTTLTARTVGLSEETVIALDRALQSSGSSIDSVGFGLKSFVASMNEASQGSKEATDKFGALGIEVTDSGGRLRDVNDVLLEAIDRIGMLSTPTEQAAAAIEMFGGRGAELVAALGGSSDSIRMWGDEAQRAGLVINESAIAASNDFDVALTKLGITVDAVKMGLGQEFTPQVIETVAALSDFVITAGKVISVGRELGDVIGKITLADYVVGGFKSLGGALLDAFTGPTGVAAAIEEVENAGKAIGGTAKFFQGFGAEVKRTVGGTEALKVGLDGSKAAATAAAREIDSLTAAIEKLAPTGGQVDELSQRLSDLQYAGKITYDEFARLSTILDASLAAKAAAADFEALSIVFDDMHSPLAKVIDSFGEFEQRMKTLGVTLDAVLSPAEELKMLEADLTIAFDRGAIEAEQYAAALDAVAASKDNAASAGINPTVVGAITAAAGGNAGQLLSVGATAAGAAVAGPVGAAVGQQAAGMLQTLAGEGGAEALGDELDVMLEGIIDALPELVTFLMTELPTALVRAIPDLVKALLVDMPTAFVEGLATWWVEAWSAITGFFAEIFDIDLFGEDGWFKQTAKTIGDAIIGFIKPSEGFDKGGYVPSTRVAMVHAGERIVRAGPNSQDMQRWGGALGGSTFAPTINAPVLTPDAVRPLVRELERLYSGRGLRTSSVLS